jgi:hypothetical protein
MGTLIKRAVLEILYKINAKENNFLENLSEFKAKTALAINQGRRHDCSMKKTDGQKSPYVVYKSQNISNALKKFILMKMISLCLFRIACSENLSSV